MDSSTLADRLRGMLRTPPQPAAPVCSAGGAGTIDAALGGVWAEDRHGRCFVVERRFAPSAQYGRTTVGAIVQQLADGMEHMRLVGGATAARPPFLFFDLETTGLSGGAGTYAFLVGWAWGEADGSFVVRQVVLSRPADERPMLSAIAAAFGTAGALVSFNGRSFDAPLLETRYLYHRLSWSAGALPHVDVLHPARRFWRETGAGATAESGCSLVTLERQILGARRSGDVPGMEIPARYFQFVRTGDARPLAAVLEHNRLDLLSLAGLTAALVRLVDQGPACARHAREALALGQVYARAGLEARAREAFEYAAGEGRQPLPGMATVEVDALRALAVAWRRVRRHDDAARCWRRLLDRNCPAPVAREATQALAIYHEHRLRDLKQARMFALQSLESGAGEAWRDAARHRLSRIDRKMTGAAGRAALDLD